MIAYLGLGSNLPSRHQHLRRGIAFFQDAADVEVLRQSSIIETQPYGLKNQPKFLNCVLEIQTSCTPQQLLALCMDAEAFEHRERTQHWGPRTLDCDILLFGGETIHTPTLHIPHPDLQNRMFVLTSLQELCPQHMHPEQHKTIETLYEELRMKQTAAIILAAGKGTRMKSDKPKVVFPLAGKPLIQWVIDTALQVDCSEIVCVVGYKKEVVIDTVLPDERIDFVEQIEQNGTGHAVMVTRDAMADFEGTVFILCGDVPLLTAATLERMREHHLATGAQCTVLTAVMDDPLRYGRILRNEAGNVQGIVEFKDATEAQKEIKEINTGIYCFDAASLFDALDSVNNSNNQKEYYLTDTLEILNNKGKLVTSVVLDDMVEASGINSQEQLKQLEEHYLARMKK